MVQVAEPVSVESFAHDLPTRYLACRELGHRWRPHTVERDPSGGGFFRRLRCTECRTVREQLLDSQGHTLRNGYDYPDGYLSAGKVERGRHSRDVYRLEAIVRFLDRHN